MLLSTLKKTLPILLLLLIRTEAFADSAILDLTGSNLIVSIEQYGGDQSLDLTSYGNNHGISIIQKNTGKKKNKEIKPLLETKVGGQAVLGRQRR